MIKNKSVYFLFLFDISGLETVQTYSACAGATCVGFKGCTILAYFPFKFTIVTQRAACTLGRVCTGCDTRLSHTLHLVSLKKLQGSAKSQDDKHFKGLCYEQLLNKIKENQESFFFYNKNLKILYFSFVKNLIHMKDSSFMLEVIK